MEKDKSHDKYTEITQQLKQEKMTWEFEDFLEKTTQEEKIIPLHQNTKGGSFPKKFWMAASVILLISVGIFFNYKTEKSVKEKDHLVQNEILKQKDSFQKESQLAINLINDSLKIKSDSIISDSASTVDQNETDIMNQILPKRGRIRRDSKPKYAQNNGTDKAAKAANTDYKSNYVIINGQKIESEQEAIDLTKYSFRILSENVSKTVAQTDVINNLNNDY